MRLLTCLAALFLLTSCLNDEDFLPLSELEPNPLTGDNVFTADVDIIFRGGIQRDIAIDYAHIYDQLGPEQQEAISGVRIVTPRRTVDANLERDRVFETGFQVGQDVCYVFMFLSGEATSPQTEVCFTVE